MSLFNRLLAIVFRRALPVPVVEVVEAIVEEATEEPTAPATPYQVIESQRRQMVEATTAYRVPPPLPVTEEFPWLPIALAEMDVAETPGSGNTPRVLEYLRSTNVDIGMAGLDATPWCSGFVNWCVKRSGHVGTNSAAARSWLHWGSALGVPRRGCIVVFSRDAGGHVGFFLKLEGDRIFVLGGNQHDKVSVAPYPSSRLLGYRGPTLAR
jgi:uncharacterized protein (TIGR02594 family)